MSMYAFTVMSGERWKEWLNVAKEYYADVYQDDDIENITAKAYSSWDGDGWGDKKEIKKAFDSAAYEYPEWDFFHIDVTITDESIGREFMRHRNKNWDDMTEHFDKYINYSEIGNDLMGVEYDDLFGYVIESELVKYYVDGEPKGIVMYRWVNNY